MTESVGLYRAVMLEIERRRVQLGFTFIDVDNLAGLNDGYLAKMMWPETPSGRVARWQSVQDVLDALFPRGFRVKIEPVDGAMLDEPSIRKMTYLARVPFDRKLEREQKAEYGRRGAEAANAKRSPSERREIARQAARKRWSNWRALGFVPQAG